MSFKRILICLPVHRLARLVHLEMEFSPTTLPVKYFNNATICGENGSSYINRYTVYKKCYFYLTKQNCTQKNMSNLGFNRHHKSER